MTATASKQIALLRRYFLNRTDRLAFLAPWNSPCPIEGGDTLDAALAAHISGDKVPAVTITWITEKGKTGRKVGHFRLGSYSPATDGRTLFAVVDCDGGGRHSNPLADPLGVALRILDALQKVGVVAYLECSGSGAGWHVWTFFETPIAAAKVRRLLFALVPKDALLKDGKTADAASNLGMEVFPKQDTIDVGGLGNMVFLPWWYGAAKGGCQFYEIGADGEVVLFMPEDFDTVAEEDLDRALAELPAPQTMKKAPRFFTYEGNGRDDRDRVSAETLLNRALNRASAGRSQGRNDSGFWLACQLRDNTYTKEESRSVLEQFVRQCPETGHPYTTSEAAASLDQAYKRGAREPWSRATAFTTNGHANQNGTASGDGEPAGGASTAKASPDPETPPKRPGNPLGPFVLRPGAASRTPSKLSVQVGVFRGDEMLTIVTVTSSASGSKEAARTLKVFLDGEGATVERDEIERVLGRLLAGASESLDRQAKPTGPTVAQILAEFVPAQLQLKCRTPKGIWSETEGVVLDRQGVLTHALTNAVLSAAEAAADLPRPAPGVPPSRFDVIRAVEMELRVLYGELMRTLPPEADSQLTEQTAKAEQFRDAIRSIWKTPQTFEVLKDAAGDKAARATLISRVQTAAKVKGCLVGGIAATGYLGGWQRAQHAFDAWWRAYVKEGKIRIALAMSGDLLEQIRNRLGDNGRGIVALGERYGAFDAKPPVPDRPSKGKCRLGVLTEPLVDELLWDASDDAPEQDPDSVTE